MKKEEIYASLEFVSDAYLESAADAMMGMGKGKGKGKRHGLLWKQLGVAAACLVLLTAAVVTLPLSRSDRSEGITTSGEKVPDIPVYEDAFYSASDIAEVFDGSALDGPTNRYSTVYVPDAEHLTLNALPEEDYLPVYQDGADGKASDESELVSFAEERLERLAESLGIELPAFKISTSIGLNYEPVNDSEMAYWLDAYQHKRYNYIFATGQETDQSMFLDGEQIAVRQTQNDEAIIESLASVKEKLFAVFGVSFTDVKVVRSFDAYSLHGVESLAVYFYNAADHPLNEYVGARPPYSDYIRLYFDNQSNFEGDSVSDDLLTEVEIRFCESRVKQSEAQSVIAKAKMLSLDSAEEMLAAGYVFGGHSCVLCMEAQDKVDFAEYDYVSFEYVLTQPYGQQVSKGFPFYAFYKQIGTAQNGNKCYAKTYVPAIEVKGLADYFESQAEKHPETEISIPPIPKPMESDEVEQWMADHVLLNDKIDPNGYIASANVRFLPDNGLSNLFDNIIGKADEENADGTGDYGTAGAEVGMMTFEGSSAALYWSMTEPVKLGSYVIYNGKNGEYSFVNPCGWKLYGSNEPIGVDDIDPETFQSASAPADKEYIEQAGYYLLDDVFEGYMGYTVCTPYGYKIASDRQAEFQYYCLFIEYGIEYGADVHGITQIAELKLYAAD